MSNVLTWKVWGNEHDPLFEGTEEEAKDFLRANADREDAYLEDPDGREFMLDESGTWAPAT